MEKNFFHALLIVGGSAQLRLKEAETAAARILSVGGASGHRNLITIRSEERTIGIGRIRELKEEIKLKISSKESRVVKIIEAQDLTPEAQNALLKTLEEPPKNLTLILTAPDRLSLLPTVISRCFVKELSASPSASPTGQLGFLISATRGERLEFVEKNRDLFSSREETVAVIDTWIAEIGKTAVNRRRKDTAILFDQLISLKETILTTNANVRLFVENFLLRAASSPKAARPRIEIALNNC